MKIALIALLFFSVQDEDISIWEAKFRHEKTLLKVPGVKRLSIGGIGEKMNLIVTVDSWKAGETVKKMTGGALDGWPIYISISRSKSQSPPECSHCPTHCRRGGKTVAAPPVSSPDPDDPRELCDILRRLSKKSLRKGAKSSSMCRQMVGWTNSPRKLAWIRKNRLPNWSSKEFGSFGDTVAYTYIRHRRDCPLRPDSDHLERVLELTPKKK